MNTVCRAVFLLLVILLLGACQQAYLIPSEEEEDSRSKDGVPDSIDVDVDFEAEDWETTDSVTFTFGGEPVAVIGKEGGNE